MGPSAPLLAVLGAQMASPDAQKCIWRCARCTKVHLEVHKVHLEVHKVHLEVPKLQFEPPKWQS